MYHYRIAIAGASYLDAGPRLFGNGAAGVDLFFIISGFIMVHTTRQTAGGVRDASRFFLRRVARIWPVYVILTFALLIAEGTLAKYTTTHDGLVWLGRAFIFRPENAGGAPWFGWAPNGVGWTLNYEIWFYSMFAVALLAMRRWRWPLLVGLFACFYVAVPLLLAGEFSPSVYASYHLKPVILNLGASSMSLEFLAGALVGAIYHSSFRIHSRQFLVGFAALSTVTVVCLQITDGPFQHHGMTGWGAQMVVMVLALSLLDREYPIRVPRALVWLGDISFSLYLLHKVVQFGLPKLVPDQIWQWGAAHVIMCLAVSLALAQLSYRVLEQGLAAKLQKLVLRLVPKASTVDPIVAEPTVRARLAS